MTVGTSPGPQSRATLRDRLRARPALLIAPVALLTFVLMVLVDAASGTPITGLELARHITSVVIGGGLAYLAMLLWKNVSAR